MNYCCCCIISAMLKMGASKPWQDAMEALTGQREVLATPLLNYFEPLRVWLEQKNAETNEYIGWDIPPAVAANSATSIDNNKDQEQQQYPSSSHRQVQQNNHRQGLNGLNGIHPAAA